MKAAAKKSFEQAKVEIQTAVAKAKDMALVEAQPAEVLSVMTKTRKSIEEKRKEATAPARQEREEIDEAFKEALSPVIGAEEALRQRVGEEQQLAREAAAVAQKKAREEEARLQAQRDEEAHANEEETVIVTVAPAVAEPRPVQTSTGTVGGTTTYDIEIVDPSLIPLQWMMPDEKALRAHARAKKDDFDVPGVRAVPRYGSRVT